MNLHGSQSIAQEYAVKKSLLDCKVLIVEDVYESRLLVRNLMGRLGVTLLEAGDGLEGVQMAKRELPDLILMDLSLPVMDGWEATRQLKADPATSHIPVVIVTAHSMWDEALRVREVGCAGYLMKPLDPIRFSEEVAQCLIDGAPRSWVPGV
jgi:two-component system cell cycle response regulator DivK